MNEQLTALARLIEQRSGLSLSHRQLPSLAGALRRVSPGIDLAAFVERLGDEHEGPRLLERLIDEVTINETFFLRERDQLATIDWPALLAGARARGERCVRVWSAACATGEEAYTLALLAGEALGWPDPPVEILGTDISATALALARRARYRKRSMRHLEEASIDRHFERHPGACSPRPHLRRLVRFAPHNLARASLPPDERGFDLVVCRNVLIYFSPEAVQHALAQLGRAVVPGGRLLLGAADRLAVPAPAAASRTAPRRPAPASPRRRARTVQRRSGGRAPHAVHAGRRPALAPGTSAEDSLSAVLALADAGELQQSAAAAGRIVAREPANAEALFVLGMTELASGRPTDAARSLRAALYVRPSFAVAAFTLGRAHDALGDARAAKRSYEQALRSFDPDDERQRALLEQIDLADLAGACQTRLAALAGADARPHR